MLKAPHPPPRSGKAGYAVKPHSVPLQVHTRVLTRMCHSHTLSITCTHRGLHPDTPTHTQALTLQRAHTHTHRGSYCWTLLHTCAGSRYPDIYI